ncbi:NAD(P)/FAD-dependent oxidoreductase [Azospirillum sp. sgz301742]
MIEHLDTDIAVIGGGIVGGSAALFLRRMGFATVLLERDWCGAKASGVNFGGVRRQGRPLEQLPLAQRAHALWGRLPELVGSDGEYLRSGHLKLARSEADLESLIAYRDRAEGFGLGLEIIAGQEFRDRWPALGERALGGSQWLEDQHRPQRAGVHPELRQDLGDGADRRGGGVPAHSDRRRRAEGEGPSRPSTRSPRRAR